MRAANSHPKVKEQLGGAAILFDPYSVNSIANAIEKVWTNKNLREELRQKSFKKAKSWGQEQFNKKFIEIF